MELIRKEKVVRLSQASIPETLVCVHAKQFFSGISIIVDPGFHVEGDVGSSGAG